MRIILLDFGATSLEAVEKGLVLPKACDFSAKSIIIWMPGFGPKLAALSIRS